MKIKANFEYQNEDMTESQMYTTIRTFDRCAHEYSTKWERNPKTISEIKKFNIEPFIKYAKPNGNVLVAGCQSGRDYEILQKEGYKCLGIGNSYGLLIEANKIVDNGTFIHLDIRSLPFIPSSFDAVYADALSAIPRGDIYEIIRDFYIFLNKSGVLYLSFKVSKDNSKVLVMKDLKGNRYLTLFTEDEVTKMLTDHGFKIKWSKLSKHTDDTLPSWLSLIVVKD